MPAVKKTISYIDLDGVPQSVDWWFSLGKTDGIEMDLAHMDNPGEYLDEIMRNQNTRNLLDVWKELLFHAVAKREGNYLVKNEQVLAEFVGSGAYEAFYEEIAQSEDAGAAFFMSIMPEDVRAKAQNEHQQGKREYTNQELLEMTDEAFYAAAGTDRVQDMDKRFLQLAMQRKLNQAA
uniref:Tail assembly chaperone n=1 Tax=Streptomyces phage Scarif TaxID=3158858 RepID=A0AAU7GYG9_9CAUD